MAERQSGSLLFTGLGRAPIRKTDRAAVSNDLLDRVLLQSIVDYAIFMIGLDGEVLSWNVGARRMKGYEAGEIIGRNLSVFYTPQDRADGLPEAILATVMDEGRYDGTGWKVRNDGSTFWARSVLTPVFDEAGRSIGFAKITQDLTREKRQEDEFLRLQDRLDLTLGNMPHGLAIFDSQDRIYLWNERWLELTGYDKRAIYPGVTYVEIVQRMLSLAGVDSSELAQQALENRRSLAASLVRAKGAAVVEERLTERGTHVYSHRSTADGGWMSIVEDVTERRRTEERLMFLTRHDALTGLPHRGAPSVPSGSILGGSAFLYIELRRFKSLIDAHGHAAGDHVLKVVAKRISEQLRQQDVAIRLGGDEFIVMAPSCVSQEHARGLANRLIAAIQAPVVIDGGAASVTVNVGIALSPRDGADFGTLLDRAHLALHAQQETGLGGTTVYDPQMQTSKRERGILEQELHDALSSQAFEVAFQPIVSADEFVLTGFEVLLRWTSPSQGRLSPAKFVPIAEELGLMCDIDEWVLRTACANAVRWDEGLVVSVNLSATQLRKPGLADRIAAILSATGLAGERLEVEITETAYIDNLEQATAAIKEVRALGVHIALDDFGTGFSSLSLVRVLPFTRIKIDRSFIQEMGTSVQSSAIVQAVCSLCENLDVQVTAEGVETIDLARHLRARGCTNLQGYVFGRPIPADLVDGWMEARRRDGVIHVRPSEGFGRDDQG